MGDRCAVSGSAVCGGVYHQLSGTVSGDRDLRFFAACGTDLAAAEEPDNQLI